MRHRILLQTNPPWIKTGLAEAGKTLMKYLYGLNKYDLAYYCTQTSEIDNSLRLTPWKSYGALPADQNSVNELNRDPGKARDAAYGAWNIDKVIKDFKPTILLAADDYWAFPRHAYMDKPWWKVIHPIFHVTVDSLPVLDQAYEQAKLTPNYITWAKFAKEAMNKAGPEYAHVKQIYGAVDNTTFSPISEDEKAALRKSFNISPTATVFNYVFRNQLRKRAVLLLQAFGEFKREHPNAEVKLHLHTSVSEKANGWDFPKMIAHHGINPQDVLFTYVCKHCGQWAVNPYVGEDSKCPYCSTEKSMVTVNIVNGVPGDQMRYVYGIADACFSVHNSGGQELCCNQALMCGKPLACTNYASGEDFCKQSFVHAIGYTPDNEPGTNFIKAVPDVGDIKSFMRKVWKSSKKELAEWGEQGRVWASHEFDIKTIGKQWEALFDSLPVTDWSSVDLTPKRKNDAFPMPTGVDDEVFIDTLYKQVLFMEETPQGDGYRYWRESLKNGMKREDVYAFFIQTARDDNTKNGAKQTDLWDLIDKTTGRKRALYVIKESNGDCLFSTQLFESFHKEYPDHDLYVATQPKFFQVFEGNPHVFKLLPFMDAMEHEMAMGGAGQSDENTYFHVYFHPGILTQRQLFYLFSK